MALDPTALSSMASNSIFNQLKAIQSPKIPASADAQQKADLEQTWRDLSDAVAKAMPDIINHFISSAQIQVTIQPGTFLVAAQAGVPNPAPVPVQGVIIA